MDATPGPWEVAELHFDGYHIKQHGTFEIRTPEYDVATYNQTGGPFRKLANAQLAAAAPELLEACKAIVNDAVDENGCTWCDRASHCEHENWCPIPLAIAAIAKVEPPQ